MTTPLSVTFIAGDSGQWRIERILPYIGEGLAMAGYLSVREGPDPAPTAGAVWALRGTTSNTRYTHRDEVEALKAKQAGLGRPAARKAALIPIRKNAAWWSLAQDERRAIFEEDSRHIGIGLDYLPAVSRRLHHGRELGEPFDFLTWFEYAPEHAGSFEELLGRLRETREWHYVDREVDIRLVRSEAD